MLDTIKHIDEGVTPTGPTAKRWGITFENRDNDLPPYASSPYLEYRVAPQPGMRAPGPLRVVVDTVSNAIYYTWTHYGQSGDPPLFEFGDL